MALGNQLREARRRMKQTASEVAAATRMKVQIVEAIEKEDFSKIAAPIYGKGFIRLYAEHVGLDPRPLVAEYTARFVDAKLPSLISEESQVEEPAPPAPPDEQQRDQPEERSPEDDALDLFSRIDREPEREPQAKGLRTVRSGKPNVRVPAWSDFRRAAVSTASRIWENTGAKLRPPTAGPTSEPSETPPGEGQGKRFPLRIVSVTVGIVVILIFVVSGLSRCVNGTRSEQAIELEPETLRLGIEPPDPYFD